MISVITITSRRAATLGNMFFAEFVAGAIICSYSSEMETTKSAIVSAIPLLNTSLSTHRTFVTPLNFAAAVAAPEQSDEAQRTLISPSPLAAETAFAVASSANSFPFNSARIRTDIIPPPFLLVFQQVHPQNQL